MHTDMSDTSGLPWWLVRTRATCATAAQRQPCHEYLKTVRKCNSATYEGGRRYRHCREVLQRFKACAGRQPEEVGYQVVETREPEDMGQLMMEEGQAMLAPDQPMVTSVDQAATPSGTRVVSAEAGQLLDEFFAFANELRESLVRSGSMQQEQLQSSRHSASSKPQQGSSLLGRLFGRGTPADNKLDSHPGGQTHSLSSCQILSQYALPKQDI